MKSGKNSPCFTGYEEISGRRWGKIISDAKKRNIEFNVDIKYAWELYEKQNRKCALSGIDIKFGKTNRSKDRTASLDRIDSSKGYVEGNIQWLHIDVNFLKHKHDTQYVIELCQKIYYNTLLNVNWLEYFINLAKIISTRSKDPSTKHGCIITDSNYRIISCGYNGPIQGIDDSIVPLTRPEKYPFFLHSEENAILFAKRPLDGCYAFITGFPCSKCARMMIQSGISKIYYGNLLAKMCDEKDKEIVELFCQQKGISLINVNI